MPIDRIEAGASALGLLTFLGIHAPPLLAAYSCSRAENVPLRVCESVLTWAAVLVGSATLLAAFGLFSALPMLALVCAFSAAMLALRWRGRAAVAACEGPSAWDRLARLAVAGLAVVLLARALLPPSCDWDSLAYHLARAASFVQNGDLREIPVPGETDNFNHFPWNGEILLATFMLPFHDDTAAALLNFPFLVLLVAALLAFGIELGAGKLARRLVVASCCSAPIILAFVPTGLVEIQIMAELAVGALFAMRALREGRGAEACLSCAALGLALGTKLTAIMPVACLLGVLSVGLVLQRRGKGRVVPTRALVAGGLLLLAFALPRYVRNFLETGNPVFPLPIPLLGRLFPHARFGPYQSDPGHGAKQDLDSLLGLFEWQGMPGMQLDVPGNGPQLLLAIPLAMLFAAFAQRGRRIWALGLCCAWLVPMAMFFLDNTPAVRSLRRFWPSHSPRYLPALLPLVSAGALGALARWPALGRVTMPVWAFFVAGNLYCLDREFRAPLLELGLATALVVLAWLTWLCVRARARAWVRAASLLACAAALLGYCHGLRVLRAEARYAHWDWNAEHHPVLMLSAMDGWRVIDDPARPMTVAFASGKMLFLYPLYGSRLQNRLVWVWPDKPGRFDPTRDVGDLPSTGDYSTWRENLRRAGVDVVFLQAPGSVEHEFVTRHLSDFDVLSSGTMSGVLTYAVLRLRN